jgi:hypothetical protein
MGLYRTTGASPNNRPGARVAQTGSTVLVNGRQEIPITPVEVAAGDYWIVTLFDTQTSVAADPGFVTIRYVNTQTPFATGLPADFATLQVLNEGFFRTNFYIVLLQ